jgi:hypothetical protein
MLGLLQRRGPVQARSTLPALPRLTATVENHPDDAARCTLLKNDKQMPHFLDKIVLTFRFSSRLSM